MFRGTTSPTRRTPLAEVRTRRAAALIAAGDICSVVSVAPLAATLFAQGAVHFRVAWRRPNGSIRGGNAVTTPSDLTSDEIECLYLFRALPPRRLVLMLANC